MSKQVINHIHLSRVVNMTAALDPSLRQGLRNASRPIRLSFTIGLFKSNVQYEPILRRMFYLGVSDYLLARKTFGGIYCCISTGQLVWSWISVYGHRNGKFRLPAIWANRATIVSAHRPVKPKVYFLSKAFPSPYWSPCSGQT